jgi:hypothetical protein
MDKNWPNKNSSSVVNRQFYLVGDSSNSKLNFDLSFK